MNNDKEKFDVVVIGGGPAGMMAAGKAASMGARVILLEKKTEAGRKLLITGKGRCNLTQGEFELKNLVQKYGKNGRFLFSSFSVFGPQETIGFFEGRGVPTKIERGARVFPVSDKAEDILSVLMKYLKENNVEIRYNCEVAGFIKKDNVITGLKIKKGSKIFESEIIQAEKYVLATGGKSYPATGSTGEGYGWLKDLGHKIIPPAPALVPIRTKEDWAKEAQGLSLKNAEIKLWQGGKKRDSRFGEMLFTHFGLSGPIVLDISKSAGELFTKGEVMISIDLKPALTHDQLSQRLQRDFEANLKKDFINYLPELLPRKIIPIISRITGIDPRKKINAVTKVERKKLVNTVKDLRLTMEGTTGFGQAIVTSGGVSLGEVDSKTMRSKIVKNLYLAGEILDLDGPTGGCNLQICWSTGFAAGTHAGAPLEEE